MSVPARAEVVVIGAGFGGIGAALSLAEAGVDVLLLEKLKYPGGCASSFERGGLRFEAGATVFSGFAPGQLFDRWRREHQLDLTLEHLDPVMRIHTPARQLEVPASRQRFVDQLCALPGAPVAGLRRYFATQAEVADTLWYTLDHPELLPPFTLRSLARHGLRGPRYARLVRWIGRPLQAVLEAHGVAHFAPLRTWLNAACQVTVQAGVDQAEAPLALAAVDFLFRGVSTVHGGIGHFAAQCVDAVERSGGATHLTTGVRGLTREGDHWIVHTRRGPVSTPIVIANVLPQTLSDWLGRPVRPGLTQRLNQSWGAVMLYLGITDHPGLPGGSSHVQVVADPGAPLIEGNHALISLGRRQGSVRTATVSTHVSMATTPSPAHISQVQHALRDRFAEAFPDAEVVAEHTASPRTFARFTGRPRGLVGGRPRTAGLAQYAEVFDGPVAPGLHLVGDSVFPGQSALAAALGGNRAAQRVLRGLKPRAAASA